MVTEFRKAQKHELPALTSLWQQCFGDEEEEIRLFWSELFDHISVYAAWKQKQPAAMLCALPIQLVDEAGECFPAAYLYAVCTSPQYRRQGLCRKLMSHAEEALKKEGFVFSCLVPAEKELFPFYAALGYKTAFFHRSYTTSAQKSQTKITKLTAEAYQNLRQMQLYGAFSDYPLSLLRWQQSLGDKTGGGLFRIETAQGVFCAAAQRQNDTLHIKELLPDCPEAAAALGAHLNCNTIHVRTQGQDCPFGMAKSLTKEQISQFSYFGLAFDG